MIQCFNARIPKRHPSSTSAITASASSTPTNILPRVVLKGGKSRLFIDQESPIVYSGAIDRVIGRPAPSIGHLVHICNGNEETFAWGVYNPNSMYRVRIMQSTDECFRGKDALPNLQELMDSRIQHAVTLRRDILGLSTPAENGQTTVWRMVNSEGDRLSGLVVDILGSHAVVSSTAAWVEMQRTAITESIQKHAPWVERVTWRQGPELLVEEGWAASEEGKDELLVEGEEDPAAGGDDDSGDGDELQSSSDRASTTVVVKEDGALFEVNPLGQKTGFYADQRDHRAFIRGIARNKTVLDLCCYSGAFSVHAALGGASSALGVDSSSAALSLAQKNVHLNNVAERCTFEKSDVSEFMKKARENNSSWDIVILDPPKLAPSRKALQKALRKYMSLNISAMKLVKPGGVFMTCSCSGAIAADDDVFTKMVHEAAQRAGRRVALMRKGHAAACHPIDPGYAEGRYLTNCAYRVL